MCPRKWCEGVRPKNTGEFWDCGGEDPTPYVIFALWAVNCLLGMDYGQYLEGAFNHPQPSTAWGDEALIDLQ